MDLTVYLDVQGILYILLIPHLTKSAGILIEGNLRASSSHSCMRAFDRIMAKGQVYKAWRR